MSSVLLAFGIAEPASLVLQSPVLSGLSALEGRTEDWTKDWKLKW